MFTMLSDLPTLSSPPAPRTLPELLEVLRVHATQPLIFNLGEGRRVPVGYHVTEVGALTYQTVDCGGVTNAWSEALVQLWRSSTEQNTEYMTAGKFVSIVEKVTPKIALEAGAELRFEYGDEGQPAVRYTVTALEHTGEGVVLHLTWIGVRCKAQDPARLAASSCTPGSGCCG